MTSKSGDVRQAAEAVRVLVVENHEDTLRVILRVLLRAGFEVRGVETCAGARAAAAAMSGPHVVIGDVRLPDGDGLALLGELKRLYGCRTVVASGYAEPDNHPTGEYDAWLMKPLNVAAIRGAVGGNI